MNTEKKTMVKLGPTEVSSNSKTLSPMMKEISSRRAHCDVVFICDGGMLLVHKFFLAAQSRFLKSVLSNTMDLDICELKLPGIDIGHLKKAVKFMYTGQLKITKRQIEQEHIVWHINHILMDLFKVDAKLNLDPSLLRPPPKNDDSDNDDNSKDRKGGGKRNSNSNITQSNEMPNGNIQSHESHSSKDPSFTENTRQNKVHEACKENSAFQIEIGEDLDVDEDRNVPTPDIINLLDSDDEDDDMNTHDRNNLSEASPVENTNKTPEESIFINTDMDIENNDVCDASTVENTNKTPEESIFINTAMDIENNDIGESLLMQSKLLTSGSSTITPVPSRTNETLSTPQLLSKDLLQTAISAIHYDLPGPSHSSAIVSVGVGPTQETLSVSKLDSGVRKHNHIPWTMSGLTRPDTINDIVQAPDGIHVCHLCNAKYEKFKSLKIHMGRVHNEKARIACPEGCGKMLTTQHAIKKHLLSHRPEHEWPYECPLCHKKFQARGDIPKHLMTRLHESDNIPPMGSKEWYDLIYHDDPKYDYESQKLKLAGMKAKGMTSLHPSY